jgi:serine/threonine protein kinase
VTAALPCRRDIRAANQLAPLPRFKAGDALPGRPGWVLDRHLGGGGFGEVWLCYPQNARSVRRAVKFCRNDENARRALLQESKVLERIRKESEHRGIVPLLDIHLEGDTPWLGFEYVEGGDLAQAIRAWQNKPIEDRQKMAVHALLQLADIVGHFHGLQPAVVHRDLKPANILYQRDTARLRITDFGIGAISALPPMANKKPGTTTKAVRLLTSLYGSHTPLYASPEQIRGAPPDPRDDVHALGVILYRILTGRMDEAPGSDVGLELKALGAVQPLIDLIVVCTARNTETRPRDAREVARRLKSAIDANGDGILQRSEIEDFVRNQKDAKAQEEQTLVQERQAQARLRELEAQEERERLKQKTRLKEQETARQEAEKKSVQELLEFEKIALAAEKKDQARLPRESARYDQPTVVGAPDPLARLKELARPLLITAAIAAFPVVCVGLCLVGPFRDPPNKVQTPGQQSQIDKVKQVPPQPAPVASPQPATGNAGKQITPAKPQPIAPKKAEDDNAEMANRAGRSHFNNGRFAEAAKCFAEAEKLHTDAMRLSPNDPWLPREVRSDQYHGHKSKGMAYLNSEMWTAAQNEFEAAQRLNSGKDRFISGDNLAGLLQKAKNKGALTDAEKKKADEKAELDKKAVAKKKAEDKEATLKLAASPDNPGTVGNYKIALVSGSMAMASSESARRRVLAEKPPAYLNAAEPQTEF